jgi:hypothetical protein
MALVTEVTLVKDSIFSNPYLLSDSIALYIEDHTGSSHIPFPPLSTISSTDDTLEEGEERQLADGRWGEGLSEETNHTTRKPDPR